MRTSTYHDNGEPTGCAFTPEQLAEMFAWVDLTGQTDLVIMPFDLAPEDDRPEPEIDYDPEAHHDAYWCGLYRCPDERQCPHLVAAT